MQVFCDRDEDTGRKSEIKHTIRWLFGLALFLGQEVIQASKALSGIVGALDIAERVEELLSQFLFTLFYLNPGFQALHKL